MLPDLLVVRFRIVSWQVQLCQPNLEVESFAAYTQSQIGICRTPQFSHCRYNLKIWRGVSFHACCDCQFLRISSACNESVMNLNLLL